MVGVININGSVRISVCEAERDFSTVLPPAPLRPGASGAVGKSVIILRACGFKAFSVEDGELVHRLLPVLGGPSPVSGDVAQGQSLYGPQRLCKNY